jgi:hypothetical protein
MICPHCQRDTDEPKKSMVVLTVKIPPRRPKKEKPS